MLRVILLGLILTACGSDDSSSGSSAPVLTEFLLSPGTCDARSDTCSLWIKGTMTDGADPAAWEIAFTLAQGYSAPDCTIDNSYKLQGSFMQFPLPAPSGTTWTARGCVWSITKQAFEPEMKSSTIALFQTL